MALVLPQGSTTRNSICIDTRKNRQPLTRLYYCLQHSHGLDGRFKAKHRPAVFHWEIGGQKIKLLNFPQFRCDCVHVKCLTLSCRVQTNHLSSCVAISVGTRPVFGGNTYTAAAPTICPCMCGVHTRTATYPDYSLCVWRNGTVLSLFEHNQSLTQLSSHIHPKITPGWLTIIWCRNITRSSEHKLSIHHGFTAWDLMLYSSRVADLILARSYHFSRRKTRKGKKKKSKNDEGKNCYQYLAIGNTSI